jgi:uncharacterized protein YbbC (DUF1343 family)/CubicO group peptidase (beta-lactamase class C family)
MRLRKPLVILILCILIELLISVPAGARDESEAAPALSEKQLSLIAKIVEGEIASGKIPGAVVLIGNQGSIIYRCGFGNRAIKPKKLPMKADTIFDIASLTKVVATTTAVMQLVEKGKLRIEDRVAGHWPEFAENGKGEITVRQLLTHYSGLRPGLDANPDWAGCDEARQMILLEKPAAAPDSRFIYSDINFIILGELVRRVSGYSLDTYCTENIFKPLGMKDTGFNPPPALRSRIAPTQHQEGTKGKILLGEVHDPTAHKMGGVAGHAGLFSTADDLAIFAQTLLDGGTRKGVSILNQQTLEKITTPQSPAGKVALRGLGWDIDSPFSSNREELYPVGSFGHTGFTGTSIWIDPVSKTYIILLTNRVHPNGNGKVKQLRSQIASVVCSALGPVSAEQILSAHPTLKDHHERTGRYSMTDFRDGKVHPVRNSCGTLNPVEIIVGPNPAAEQRGIISNGVKAGIEVLNDQKFASLSGLRVGLITNHSGIDSEGRRTIDLLYKAPGVKLASIFVPEHGLTGKMEGRIPFSSDSKTGLPVYGLYGDINRPTAKMLEGLNAIVFDIQDVGVRFYTYITTMAYAMEASAKKGIAFYVLDRPNPLTGTAVQGPVMERSLKSFVGYFPLPIRYGMTIGELACMFSVENQMGVDLKVIKMEGYHRNDWYDETGLKWVSPSPNLRTLTQAILYPGIAMVEGANVSVGRGTETPFELLGSPWIKAKELASYLNRRKINGVRFTPVSFVPRANPFRNQTCHGVQIFLTDRQIMDTPALGIEIVSGLHRLYPKAFHLDETLSLIGSRQVIQAIKKGQDPASIIQSWQPSLEMFNKTRSKYLLY